MPRKKKKTPEEMGEIELIWHQEEQAKIKAKKEAIEASEPPKPPKDKALSAQLEPFFTQVSKHRFGTCWKCGNPRETPGGSPGGYETFYCCHCDKWLTIRYSRSDVSTLQTTSALHK